MRFAALLMIFAPLASAEEVKIVLWNGEKLFDLDTVTSRAGDLQQFGEHFRAADIIILDEVCSLDVVNAARDGMGFSDYYTACSDFAQDDFDTFNSLEVGLLSRFPLEHVVEFDPTPDNTGTPGEPAEKQLLKVELPGIRDVDAPRGFLTADIPALGLTLVATHLKSSQGSAGAGDQDNAMKRELVAAAIATFVADTLRANTKATVLVGGDLNVGETDLKKNGFRLTEDRISITEGDLYDDTHALLSAGLVDGLHMASLTKGLGTETYDDPQFAGSGPIDCLYVAGQQTGDFTLATKSAQTFGSDHFAVSTRFLFSGTVPNPESGSSPPIPVVGPVRISTLLPNPIGPDGGHEWVKLRNNGSEVVNLDGWKLRDDAKHTVALRGTIAPGIEMTIELTDGQMPLNNGGDEIELLDAAGQSVQLVSYSGDQAAPGQEVHVDP